jgi:hypothetical protein
MDKLVNTNMIDSKEIIGGIFNNDIFVNYTIMVFLYANNFLEHKSKFTPTL